MLKEVGASGQISLGKKYAGQLFEVAIQADGSILMQPVKVVPMVQSVAPVALTALEERAPYTVTPAPTVFDDRAARMARRAKGAARSPEQAAAAHAHWEEENKDAIAAFNERAKKIGSMGRRIHEWRQADALHSTTQTRDT
jgi:post-segregation antitoxin (ccd killing protein)